MTLSRGNIKKYWLLFMIGIALMSACGGGEATSVAEAPSTAIPLSPTSTSSPATATIRSSPTVMTPTATSIPPAASPTPTLSPRSVQMVRAVPYIPNGLLEQMLDIYLPTPGNTPVPTIFMIHQGEGYKEQMSNWGRYFAKQGYAAVSINYRQMPDYNYPAHLEDAFCALAWVHANADTYSFDTQNIFAMGHSTGGTLAAMLGVVDDPTIYTEACPHTLPSDEWVQGIIPFTGIFDYITIVEQSPQLGDYASELLDGGLDEVPEIWAAASAITWVDGSEQPFLLIHGAADHSIPPRQSELFAEMLQEAGVDVELLIVPNAGHEQVINSEQSMQTVSTFLEQILLPSATDADEPGSTETAVSPQSNENLQGYEEVSFLTDDGITLAGRLFGQENDVAVVLTHKGYADQNSWQEFATLLAERGFAVLTFDFRGVGQSSGTLRAGRLEQDARTAIEFMQNRAYERIICVGASFGGTACMKAALQIELDGLVVIASRMSEGYPTEIKPEEFSLLTMPKLFVSAEYDHHDLAAIAAEMYELSPDPKSLEILPGSAHATDLFYTPHADTFRQILLDFLEDLRATLTPTETVESTATLVPECADFETFPQNVPGSLLIRIALPNEYENYPDKEYNTIYLLDANYFFDESPGILDYLLERGEGMTKIVQTLTENGAIPPSILIGIGYTEEQRNIFTTNQAENFYSFFTDELIPEIESKCRVSKSGQDRTLFGYSGSAHFSTFALMQDVYTGVETFSKFISISGVYDSYQKAVQLEETIFQELDAPAFSGKTLFIAVGADDPKTALLTAHREFTEILVGRDYANFNLYSTELAGKGHYDIHEFAFSEGLTWVFFEQ
ncbi:MAG: alpha/beta fold hydrolase [Chloroflexi bacterium]|nr:alpha/beta fold hydrolase [Chloroflexota bacterium]